MLHSLAGVLPLDQLTSALPIIASLIFLEGMLSVDNALVLAAMVKHLPEKQRNLALRLGILGAYGMRGGLMFCAAWLAANPWIKLVGAAYLLYLMCSNLGGEGDGEDEERSAAGRGLFATICMVEIADLSFSSDNILAAVALDPRFWVVCTGVAIGILAMRFVAGVFVKLIEFIPALEQVAFVLVGFIGFQLIAEEVFHFTMGNYTKFAWIIGIVVAGVTYDKVGFVKTVLDPIFTVLGVVMTKATWLADLLVVGWMSKLVNAVIINPISAACHAIFGSHEVVKEEGKDEAKDDEKQKSGN